MFDEDAETHHEEFMIFLVSKIIDHTSKAEQLYERVNEFGDIAAANESARLHLDYEISMANMFSRAVQAVRP